MKRTEDTRNTARFCVENPHITWVLLIGTILWGIYGYTHMPQRKDPDIPLKAAMVVTPWPGASAEKVEELVTKTVEQVIASNTKVSKIDSTSRSNISVIVFSLADDLNPEEVTRFSTTSAAGWPLFGICPTARAPSTTSAISATPRRSC